MNRRRFDRFLACSIRSLVNTLRRADDARLRALRPLSRSVVNALMIVSVSLVAAAGSPRLARLTAQAPISGPAAQAQLERADVATTTGLLWLNIVGPDGEPIEAANVLFNIAPEKQPVINKRVQTDTSGVAVAELPPTIQILKIFVRKEGYVPRFVMWNPRFQPSSAEVPGVFTIPLAKGTSIGGIIKDEEGVPIAGAKVEVQLRRDRQDQTARLTDDIWLAEDDAVVSKADGSWSLGNVPDGEDVEVRIKLTHSEHVNDDAWGGMQSAQGVTMLELRDQSATIVMPRGVTVTGTVKDAAGQPVASAVVVFGDDPERQQGSQEVVTDERGAYRTALLRVGAVNFTVAAAGFSPELQKIDVTKEMRSVDFSLRPGKALRVRFVDTDGKPVPGVQVLVKSWRDIQSLYNGGGPQVADMRIPPRADAYGRYVWSWAPDDEVIYNVVGYDVLAPESAKVPYKAGSPLFRGALPLELMRVTADGNEHTITVRPRRQ